MTMRVLVCGSRDYKDRRRLYATLDKVLAKYPDLYVIHGAYRGADTLAQNWADDRGVPASGETFAAQWDLYGKRAGPMRNQRMLEDGKPDAVIAFPGNDGTADMVGRAEAAGLPIWRIE